MARIVLIEDEPDLREIVQYNLSQAGHRVHVAGSADAGLRLVRETMPDIVLLDLMLPDRPGTTVCTALKREPHTQAIPVIMVTAKGDEVDRIVGLELGADDYVVKPFSVRELILRINAVLRRSEAKEPSVVELGELRLDRDAHRVEVAGNEIPMTPLEFKLLATLAQRKERVQTRSALLADVWELDPGVTSRTVDTHVKRLRDKLGSAGRFIQTVRGIGYRFSEKSGDPEVES
ncbi:MAG TPA: response regulator [Polyangiaceae bacterium]|jgi:two-component system, OmpR family, phosphate regulon response regulator PhoB|nr:response regulator [Polyangiaceae bacterium]